METQPVLIAGEWRKASAVSTFHASNPTSGEVIDTAYPICSWNDCDAALGAAVAAAHELRRVPGEYIAGFLEAYAAAIKRNADALVAKAHEETGLPIAPRLRDVELPRAIAQLRQGAAAACEGSWTHAIIDTKNNIRSHYAPLGPVFVLGPNNFPFAFNGVAGGDMTAAIAAGNPVIAKGHPLHPGTTELLARCAYEALAESRLPKASVQMFYQISHEDGLRLITDPRMSAIAFTGGRMGGMKLKEAADRASKPIYLEMSSLNPVVILPGALRERGEKIATEFADSALAGGGQFCTSPSLVLVIGEEDADAFAEQVTSIYRSRTPSVLLSSEGLQSLERNVRALIQAGAHIRTGGAPFEGGSCRYNNTLLQVSGSEFLRAGEALQVEAFGNSTLLIVVDGAGQLERVLASLDGNLTGCIYSSTTGEDDALYAQIVETLRFKVGRLLNDKMPTGVALSPAMNHGGPYPSTGHPGFTAVGIPASMLRFCALQSYDNVREQRLPPALRNKAPNPHIWRSIDGAWKQGDLTENAQPITNPGPRDRESEALTQGRFK